MRLRSLLTMADLGLELVTGEEELDRFVRWVVTTDMLDPGRYLSGGELVLTGMQWRHEPADSEVFVRALAQAGVAGLAAGDARYGGAPPDVVEACRKHRIPLFRVPENIAFAQVTEQITRNLSTGRAADLTAILDRHRQLVSGAGLGSVLELIERDLGTAAQRFVIPVRHRDGRSVWLGYSASARPAARTRHGPGCWCANGPSICRCRSRSGGC
ncbi:PucR family transcriptional regulator ligand-binding domain-containing protein, partial [Nocardia brasiliensis]|uniref:PucR family transcriptional regulator ligand-binding domain-containing protein n=1 Tax=Nocardia brasiliensis TaxID=37326 RepID=UPI002456BBDC